MDLFLTRGQPLLRSDVRVDLRTGGLHKLVVNQGVVTMVTVVEWFILAPETNSIRKPERELFRLSYYHNLNH